MGFLSSTRASVALLAVMSLILAAATIVERYAGTSVATAIYHNPLVIILWALLVANWLLIRVSTYRATRIPAGSSLLHFSFAVILTGAFVTMLAEEEGNMRLDSGQTEKTIVRNDGVITALPFSIRLDSLEISRYSGTGNPSGFTSHITVKNGADAKSLTVSVNHPLRLSGWRIYQASYEPGTKASILRLSHDPWGTAISYSGYVLLFLAFLLLTFSPSSRFSRLRRKLSAFGCAAFLLAGGSSLRAADLSSICWDGVAAMDSRGRIVTLDTYCRELMRKIHHDEEWNGVGAVGSVIGIMSDPGPVYDAPFIFQKNREIATVIGQRDGKFVSFGALLNEDGSYKIADLVSQALSVPPRQRSPFQKDVLKLDEKANLLYSIVGGKSLPVFPVRGDETAMWLSPGDDLSYVAPEDSTFIREVTALVLTEPSQDAVDLITRFQEKCAVSDYPDAGKKRLELLFNRVGPFKTGIPGYLMCSLFLLVISLLVRGSGHRQKAAYAVALCAAALVLLLHTWGIVVRWYCSGQPPLSNAYEVTVFLSWCMALISILLSRRSMPAAALGLMFSGVLLAVAGMNSMDPAITPLVPVLQSPWLMFHVAVIIAGYGCFGINFLLSVYCLGPIAVCGQNSLIVRKTAVLVEMFALAGLMLMTLGTFLGAVWAGESWGSYWSWDPKETWALITVLVYAICTHSRLVPRLNSPKWLCLLSIIGFLCVLMTYFGVNYFLVGMHSYAN